MFKILSSIFFFFFLINYSDTGLCRKRFKFKGILTKNITALSSRKLAILPNGNLVCSNDSYINIWNLTSNKLVENIYGHLGAPYYITVLRILSNGYLASGSSDASLKVWDPVSGRNIADLRSSFYGVFGMAVLPNGFLASTSPNSSITNYFAITVWNTNTYQIAFTLKGHNSFANWLDVLDNGDLVSCSSDGIKIWNTQNQSLVLALNDSQNSYPVKVLPNGYLASGNTDGSIKIWNTKTGSLINILKSHTKPIETFAVFSNGYLISGSQDETIKIWDPISGILKNTLSGFHKSAVTSLATFNTEFLASASTDSVLIWR